MTPVPQPSDRPSRAAFPRPRPPFLHDEAAYDRLRMSQWLGGEARADGVARRDMLKLFAAAGLVAVPAAQLAQAAPARAASGAAATTSAPGIVKPLPPELFIVHDTNAETRFESLRATGYHTPVDRFFVRNHTVTPSLDRDTWRLAVFGSGLRGAPGEDRAVEFGFHDLCRLPSVTLTAAVECAGNGRSFFATQQGEAAPGTPWTLGGIGVARWRGVRLAQVLRRAGLTGRAVDVQPRGLDDPYVRDGIDYGRVRRPLPVTKALDDVVLAYEMNGEPLPPDHGFPVRVLVPSWVGIASIKWVGSVEVSAEPLFSPWNTAFYRLFGPGYPPEGSAPLTRQTLKSAWELPRGARFAVRREVRLHGRSWSGAGTVREVEVSTDGGNVWRTVRLHDVPREHGWVRWSTQWRPRRTGTVELLARATDSTGRSQPDRTPFNSQGYLFDAVVRHPVTVV